MRNPKRISYEEIKQHSSSMVDEVGFLFWWQGSLYRAIKNKYVDHFRFLLTDEERTFLLEAGLVDAQVCDIELEGCGLIIKHRTLPFVSYSSEWTVDMLKDSALFVCDLVQKLNERNLTLKDSHPWNILFDNGRFVYVDWGSIVSCESALWPYKEFADRFLKPLLLMSEKKSWIARDLMMDVSESLSFNDVLKLMLSKSNSCRCFNWWRRIKILERYALLRDVKFFQRLREFINEIHFSFLNTEWSNYQGVDSKYALDVPKMWPTRISRIHNLISVVKPRTVLDIGCNRGWFSKLAANLGAKVVALDIDEYNANKLYLDVKQHELPVLPLVMDFCKPTPAHGLAHGYLGADERYKSEMVLALAVTHHLVFKRGISFDTIAKQLALFSCKHLVVEFVPPEDMYVKEWMSERFDWYNLGNFMKSLSKYFTKISVFSSDPVPRKLLYCEKA